MPTCSKVLTLLIAMAWAGCSMGGPAAFEDPTYDSEKAREILTAALDAWKQGKAAQLTRRQPPIRFLDEDCRSGWQLVSFEFNDPTVQIRPFQGVPLMLVLRDPRGQEARREVLYQVALTPSLAVMRCDS